MPGRSVKELVISPPNVEARTGPAYQPPQGLDRWCLMAILFGAQEQGGWMMPTSK